jgi:hypothetical protein
VISAQDLNDDAVLKPAEPDFTLVSLPTSLRLPTFKSAFRVTHRFTRPLNCDTCRDSLAGDGFGIDNGAVIGLEYRFGIAANTEIGVYRTNDKTVELFGQYGLLRQSARSPHNTHHISTAAHLSIMRLVPHRQAQPHRSGMHTE